MPPRPRPPTDRESWNQIYAEHDLPWDTGAVDGHLPDVLARHAIPPGKALEVGCGTGTNSIWLARQGFTMTALDLAPNAIAKAKAKAAAAGVRCRLLAGDILQDSVPGAPFRFVYDRGVFHVFQSAEKRSRFAARVAELLRPQGIWHSLIGSTDGPARQSGPPRVSATEIAKAVEPHFEILELRSSVFDSQRRHEARAWVLVARKRVLSAP